MTIKASSYPTSRPTLDLNFAQTKRLDPRVTFSRSSSGTYFDANGVLQSAATNTARFDHNPATGESLGLLVEESRANLATYSEHFDNAAWTKTNIAVTPNSALAPDNTFTADLIAGNGASGNHWLFNNTNDSSAGTRTYSIYAKANTHNFIQVLFSGDGGPYANFNLSTGVVGNTGTSTTASIQAVGNGWYRCIVYTSSASATTPYVALVSSATAIRAESNSLSTSVYLWAAQSEFSASFPTSYIPTPATFTSRASSATYYDASGVIQTAGTNVARSAAFFPDSNGVMRSAGLLLEAAGTNLLLRSQEIDNVATWAGSYKLNYSANATTAPDGTATADKVIPNTENVSHSTFQDPAGTISGTYTFSLYAKASGYNKIVLFIDGASAGGSFGSGSAVFDLSTKAITNINGSAAIETLPNGWYRCSVTGTSGSAVTVSTGFGIYDNSGNSTFIGNGTDGIFIWGAQLEASPYATSYIATTTATVTRSADVSSSATVTRSADVASITGANFSSWYNQTEGTVFAEFAALLNNSQGAVSLRDSGVSNNARVRKNASNNYVGVLRDGIVKDIAVVPSPALTAGQNIKIALALKSNDCAVTGGGQSPTSQATYILASMTTLDIGGSNAIGEPAANSTIRRITYWPTRLSNATLQAITL